MQESSKVHRVFPSRGLFSVSAPEISFAHILKNISVEVVKPFHARRNLPNKEFLLPLEPVKVYGCQVVGAI